MHVSLIATVKNEADNIAELLQSMLAQTRLPDEIVINDNGSSDATATIVAQWQAQDQRIRLVQGGHNIPSGRNHAIKHAQGPLIASCDAGLVLPPHWLEAIVAPLVGNEADVVGGFYEPDARSLWELALAATNYPDAAEVDPATFLPAGQSMAFTKTAWASVGGYPEWADTCEDLVFDRELKQRGFRFAFVPRAAVHFRPRPTPLAYWKQYFTYARGDGVARLFGRRHALRYGAYTGFAALLWAGLRHHRWWLLLLLSSFGLHSAKPFRRAWSRSIHLPIGRRAIVLLLVPLCRLIGDIAKMIGYPFGVWRRRGIQRTQYVSSTI